MYRPRVGRSSPVQFCEPLEPRRFFSALSVASPDTSSLPITPSAVINRAPFSIIKANPTSGPAPLLVNFAGNDSYDTDNLSEVLKFTWDFGDGTNAAGAGAAGYYISHTYNNAGQYTAKLTVTDNQGASTTSQLTINVGGSTSNQPPKASIDGPSLGAMYAAGQTIDFWGTAPDPEQGQLGPAAFTWSFVFHHENHTHPFLPDRTNTTWGSFQIPLDGETDPDQFYTITLTVKDAGGLTNSTFVNIKPRTSSFTVNSNVVGAALTLDGQPFTTSKTVTGVVNQTRALSAPATQTINGTTYAFTGWSDGGAATHNISTPPASNTYTANYQPTNQPPTINPEILRAAADTYARDGDYSANIFGALPDMQVKKTSEVRHTREAFLRFAMTSIASIGSAKLRVFGRLSGPESTNVPLGLFTTSDTTWSESSLNYFTRPATSGPIAQVNVLDTTERWYEFDVTNYLKQQKSAAASGVGFALKALAASQPYMIFNSDEAVSNQPQLIVTPATASTNIIATDDTYARDGDFASTNFGNSGELISKNSTLGFNREIFLKFDLSSISSASAFSTGRLRLFGSLNESATPPGLDVAIFATSTSWSENTLTWNARPSTTSVRLFSVPISSTAPQWYEWELTSWLKQEKAAGRNIVSFVIRNLGSSTQFARFASTESGANQPQLVFT